MRIRQDYWLWRGHPDWSAVQAGPAKFFFQQKDEGFPQGITGPALRVVWSGGSEPGFFEALGSDGKKLKQPLALKTFEMPWKGGVTVTFLQKIEDATPQTRFSPSRIQYGNRAPPPALLLEAEGSSIWLGLGERGTLSLPVAPWSLETSEVGIAFMPRRLMLPFSIQLDRFQIDRYAGTMDPSAYFSIVTAPGKPGVKISMNEPLHHQGFTFYQASYEEGSPRPTVSIFSVNQDPGRGLKYFGSALIVLGSILLFYRRIQLGRKAVPLVELQS
jgi:hypothetical protein